MQTIATTKPVSLGKSIDGHAVKLDVGRLITTRMLVTANSGGGKSWLLRLLFEQLGDGTQLIVLDREGEFVTLRERLDVLLVGPSGEIPTDVRSAGLLVRRLMERRISAVVDMGELPIGQQRHFVRLFLEAMIALPKDLWHPCFVGLDETHLFCPEKGSGEAESTEAVINLATLGRKRGYCPIFATQRISKFNKDAAAELGNKFIGRTTLDVDQKRAGDELGLSKERYRELRDLSPPGHEGEFYAFGPALDLSGVVRFRAGKVNSTHPEPGQGRMIEPPKPSRAIAAVLGELKDLPQQAEEESKTIADARRTIADLKRQLAAKDKAQPSPAKDDAALARARQVAAQERDREWKPKLEASERGKAVLVGKLSKIAALATVNGEAGKIEAPAVIKSAPPVIERPSSVMKRPGSVISPPVASGDLHLGKPHRLILDTIAWFESIGDPDPGWDRICAVAGRHPATKTLINARGELRTHGLLDDCRLTDVGRSHAQTPDIEPTLEGLHAALRKRLKGHELTIFDALVAEGGRLNQNALTEAMGLHPATKTYVNARGRLANTYGLVRYEGTGDERDIVGTDLMYPEGLA